MTWFRSHLSDARVVAVVRAPHVADVVGLVTTLARAGIPTVELTFTIPDVLPIVEAAAAVEGVVVGVGSVATPEQVRRAADAGARFVVTPARRPDVESACRASGVPIVPGAMTPTEIDDAHRSGADAVKIFPARNLGPAFVADVLAPMPEIALVPSGGIGIDDAADYLLAGAVAIGTGAVTPADAVATGDLDTIRERAAAIVRSIRERTSPTP